MVKNKIISCQLQIKEYKLIEKIVDSGRYKSIKDFVTVAVARLIAEDYDKRHLTSKDFKRIKIALGIIK